MLGLSLRLCEIARDHRENHPKERGARCAERLDELKARSVTPRLDHAAAFRADAAGHIAVNCDRLVLKGEIEAESPSAGQRKRVLDPRSYGAQVQDRDPHPGEPAAEGLVKVDSLDTASLYVRHLPASLEKTHSLFNLGFSRPQVAIRLDINRTTIQKQASDRLLFFFCAIFTTCRW